ncbi:MAG TPA: type II toxin-antitoxin system RelE/ParE family toxin [Allosphingosinicella sp.]|nr:type II toxin-antitoxin system RelE/ParE family toxin [Allosphingosinicella sp.]
MKRVIPRVAAEQDIDQTVDYYTDQAGDDVARAFVDAVRDAYRAIGERPGAGSTRYADILRTEGLRTRKLGRFPYLLFYIECDDHIDVRRILHARRDIPAFLAGGDED